MLVDMPQGRVTLLGPLVLAGCFTFSPLDPDADSGGAEVGDATPTPGVCQPGCSVSADCVAAGQDATGWTCSMGACRYALCSSDADCDGGVCRDDPSIGAPSCAYACPLQGCLPGQTCEGGYCITAGCASDAECLPTHACDAGACWQVCNTDVDCGNTQLECSEGLCRVFTCTSENDCASRFGAQPPAGDGWACVPA